MPPNLLNSEQRSELVDLLAKEIISSTDSKDYSDLALFLLDTGYDSINCRILAGMQSAYKVEIEPYFSQLLEEVGFGHLQHKDDHRIQFIANEYCSDLLHGRRGTEETLVKFHSLWIASNYDPLFSRFIEIIDSEEVLKDGYALLEGFTQERIDDFVRANCLILSLHFSGSLPEKFEDYGICNNCGTFAPMNPSAEEKSEMFRKPSATCPKCGGDQFLSCSTFAGQEAYLQSLGHNFD